jgi:hypothetical protein
MIIVQLDYEQLESLIDTKIKQALKEQRIIFEAMLKIYLADLNKRPR